MTTRCRQCDTDMVLDTRGMPIAYRGETTVIPSVTGNICPVCGEVDRDTIENSHRVKREIYSFCSMIRAKDRIMPADRIEVSTFSSSNRRTDNEDRYVTTPVAGGYLLGVFDGHNGSAVADYAAANLARLFLEQLDGDHPYPEVLRLTVSLLIKECGKWDHVGSTLSVVFIRGSWALVATLGDSPVLITHANGVFMSTPHNVKGNPSDATVVAERCEAMSNHFRCFCVDNGRVHRGDFGVSLTRALGDRELEGVLIDEPDLVSLDLLPDSVVIVASDGICFTHNKAAQEDFYKLLLDQVHHGVESPYLAAWVRATHPEIRDNMTLLVAQVIPKAEEEADLNLERLMAFIG